MDTKRINNFLAAVKANNNRTWFQAHKAEYTACHDDYLRGVDLLIGCLAQADSSIAEVKAKDACFRFYRDTRFSPDKSPYKRHFGAYISAHGKKGLHAGYYIHVQPGHSFISAGAYWLPTNILTSVRNEIMANIDTWLAAVENANFVDCFGRVGEGQWDYTGDNLAPKGFGLVSLKSCPTGFPRDYEHLNYLRMKDYCVWRRVDDDFFEGDNWIGETTRRLLVAKPMMDFTNAVIDDYE